MSVSYRTVTCHKCGSQIRKWVKAGRQPMCFSCGQEAAANAARQMHARSGPAWDRFCAAMAAKGTPVSGQAAAAPSEDD